MGGREIDITEARVKPGMGRAGGKVAPRRLLDRGREVELARLVRAGLADGASPREIEAGRRAEDELARAFLPLVRSVAATFAEATETPAEDAESIGLEALVSVIRRYDPAAGRLSRFARPRIAGHIHDYAPEEWGPIRIPAKVHAALLRERRRAEREGRDDAPAKLADARRAARAASIEADRSTCGRTDYGRPAALALTLAAPDDADHPLAWEIESALASLPPGRAEAVRHRFGLGREPLTLGRTGARLGVSESRVCQMIAESLSLLRDALRRRGVSGAAYRKPGDAA